MADVAEAPQRALISALAIRAPVGSATSTFRSADPAAGEIEHGESVPELASTTTVLSKADAGSFSAVKDGWATRDEIQKPAAANTSSGREGFEAATNRDICDS
jgi:hypothetical protein